MAGKRQEWAHVRWLIQRWLHRAVVRGRIRPVVSSSPSKDSGVDVVVGCLYGSDAVGRGKTGEPARLAFSLVRRGGGVGQRMACSESWQSCNSGRIERRAVAAIWPCTTRVGVTRQVECGSLAVASSLASRRGRARIGSATCSCATGATGATVFLGRAEEPRTKYQGPRSTCRPVPAANQPAYIRARALTFHARVCIIECCLAAYALFCCLSLPRIRYLFYSASLLLS